MLTIMLFMMCQMVCGQTIVDRSNMTIGKVDSDAFRRYVNMPGIKRMNWFLNREAELYFFYFTKEQDKKMIVLEPSEELVGMIRKYVPATARRE